MYDLAHEAMLQGLRALLIAGIPIVIVLSIAGTLVSALQSATSLQDPALSYTVRLVALVVVLYLMFPAFAASITKLAELCLG